MSTDRGLKLGYLPSLDGWRAVAIVSVMMYHDRVHHLGRLNNSFLHENGALGVDLFFAISGLLICSRLIEEDSVKGSISLRGFYLRRLFRIVPAAWAFLAVYGLLGLLHQLPLDTGGIAGSLLMVRNFWIYWGGIGANTWYTVHFWSLSVEEHFYLFLPGLLVLSRRWRSQVVGGLALFFFLWVQIVDHRVAEDVAQVTSQGVASAYDSARAAAFCLRTDMRLHELLIPAFIALLIAKPFWKDLAVRWLRPWAVVPFFAAYAFVLAHSPDFHSMAAQCTLVIPLGFSLSVVSTMYHPRSWFTRVLETAPMKFFGRISFGLYLWQQIFFPNGETSAQAPLLQLQQFPFNYIAAFTCAVASYHLIERPILRFSHRVMHRVTPDQAGVRAKPRPAEIPQIGTLQPV